MDTQTRRSREASFGTLITDMTRDSAQLVRDEIELAQTEMTEKVSQIAVGIGSIAAAGAVLLSGFLVLLAAAVFGIALVLPLWLSALIIGGAVFVVGAIMLLVGWMQLRKSNLKPKHTLASLRNDRNLARQHTESATERTQ